MSTAEDHALTRLTTARPAELVSALGPRLSAAVSAGLVSVPEEITPATSAGLAAAGLADLTPRGAPGALAGPHLSVVPDPAPAARHGVRPAVPVDAALWLEVGALIPEVARRRRQPGRRRRDDRAVLEGILHVLATGIGWRELPQGLGCGSGVTCWRRLREWVDGGTWSAIEPRLRAALGARATIDWDRAWGGGGRGPATAAATSAGRSPGTRDPGATPAAVARRRAWSGPSLT